MAIAYGAVCRPSPRICLDHVWRCRRDEAPVTDVVNATSENGIDAMVSALRAIGCLFVFPPAELFLAVCHTG